MTRHGIALFQLAALALGAAAGSAQEPGTTPPPEATEVWEPVPPVVAPGPAPTAGSPPSDAIVLFDGSGLDAWVDVRDGSPAGWTVSDDGLLTVNKATGDIRTRRSFGDYQLHLEWRVPRDVTGSGQARGNSGLFLAWNGEEPGGYEVQILDSYGNETYVNGMAGSVYKQAAPLVNASRPPGEWQIYDVVWRAPVFADDGSLLTPARVTVLHNGVLVQDAFELRGVTVYRGAPEYLAHGDAPIMLQAHGDPSPPISFRNIWLRELRPAAGTGSSPRAGPAPAAPAREEGDPPLLVRNVTVVDGTGAPGRPGLDVVVRDGLIESVGPTAGGGDFDGRVVDGSGAFLVPGLIDAHVHLSGGSREEVAELLRWALEGGVTTVRDMAGDARSLAGFRQALISGELEGPALHYAGLAAGPPFMSDPRLRAATAGYAEGEAPYMAPLTPGTDLVRTMAMIRGSGATGVKLYAALSPELVEAATAEAHRAGLRVWAHSAVFPARPVEVLDAGVDGVSHAPYVIWEAEPPTPDFTLRARGDFRRIDPEGPEMGRVVDAMVRNGTVLDPTLFVFDRGLDSDTARARLEWGAAFTRRAHEAGVTIAAGTDGIGRPLAGELPNVHREMELLVGLAGLTPLEALGAATRGGARAIGIEDRVGTVEAGKVADLVLLGADPAEDIRATRRIVRVIQRGRVVR